MFNVSSRRRRSLYSIRVASSIRFNNHGTGAGKCSLVLSTLFGTLCWHSRQINDDMPVIPINNNIPINDNIPIDNNIPMNDNIPNNNNIPINNIPINDNIPNNIPSIIYQSMIIY